MLLVLLLMSLSSLSSLSSVFLMIHDVVVEGHVPQHEIHRLPNQNPSSTPTPFRQYAGHLNLTSTGENMFYWYVESEHRPSHDPLVLWLNGGPGCSSLGGFFTENGPFVVRPDLSLELNPYRWNRHANVVWLESPAGVGFSSPPESINDDDDDLSDDYYNDHTTTARSYAFVQQFFETYPTLRHRPFYITGESYAGIYIPRLVQALLENPIEGVDLRGFAIGNPFTDATIDGNAYMDYFYSHAMISMENYQDMVTACRAEIGQCMYTATNCSEACTTAIQEGILASDTDQLNPYYIYGDKCMLKNAQAGMLRYTKHHVPLNPGHRGEIGPCADEFTRRYLNLPMVQQALHVEQKNHHPVNWTDCNDQIAQVYDRTTTALPYYRSILKYGAGGGGGGGLKALIYSGDADSVVNFMGTERWIAKEGLNLTIKTKWKAWFGPDDQLAGYVQEYEGLTFKTVKGSGHMVPAIRPLHALHMFECFLYGEQRCSAFSYPKDQEEKATGDIPEQLYSLRSPLFPFRVGGLIMGAALVIAVVVYGSERERRRRRHRNTYNALG